VFHTSCLIHWIILCEFEIITNHLVRPYVRRTVKRKIASDGEKIGKEKDIERHIRTVFCPECQGTGMVIDGDGVEQPEFSLSQVCLLYRYFLFDSPAHQILKFNLSLAPLSVLGKYL